MSKTLLACALAIAGLGNAAAANIVIVNTDPAGSGLNDPTPATPVGGNPGTTVGEQRRIVFQFAADQWGAILQSNVDIRINSSFASLDCDAEGGVLAQAGALTAHANFPNAPVIDTFYNAALANSLAGADLNTTTSDILMTFQADLGQPDCIAGSGWYYGLDGITEDGKTNFLDTAMHEMGHGLNFQGRYNLANGAPPAANRTDIYSRFVFDNASSENWIDMTNAERVIAAKADALVWTGGIVTAQTALALDERVDLFLSGNATGNFPLVTAGFGPVATPANFAVGDIVYANDGVAGAGSPAGTFNDGCEAMAAGSLTGKIALVDRGFCSFKLKTLNVQAAGATGVIVANNVAAGFPGMGDDPAIVGTVTIPSIGVTQAAGTAIKDELPGVNGALQPVPGQFAGADTAGRARLYAPALLAQGSSFSHFDVSMSPDAIMEPFDSPTTDANFRLDLTPALFRDVGWVLNQGNATTRNGACNTGIKVFRQPGLIAGANLQAADKLCRRSNAGNALGYRSCVNSFVARLAAVDLIPDAQAPGIKVCTVR